MEQLLRLEVVEMEFLQAFRGLPSLTLVVVVEVVGQLRQQLQDQEVLAVEGLGPRPLEQEVLEQMV
jgi:hypothetical protein